MRVRVLRRARRVVAQVDGRRWVLPLVPSVDAQLAVAHARDKAAGGALGDRAWLDLDAMVGPDVAGQWRELPHRTAVELTRGLIDAWGL